MDLRPAEGLEWRPAPDDWFTGRAWFGPMTPMPGPDDLNVLSVAFEPGARTGWHSHPGGQVLYVVSGTGYVGTRDGGLASIGPGDVVQAAPGELHWHGATATSPMNHLSITHNGETEWTGEMVDDDQYPNRATS